MPEYTITRPTPSVLAALCQAIEHERDRYVYLPDLATLVAQWGVAMLLFQGNVTGEPAALIGISEPEDHSGWVTLYVLPQFRGMHGLAVCRLGLDKARVWGFRTLRTQCWETNRAACYVARQLGFAYSHNVGAVSTYVWHA
jgi:RimJ/RimL family protein N-acetyltransferase